MQCFERTDSYEEEEGEERKTSIPDDRTYYQKPLSFKSTVSPRHFDVTYIDILRDNALKANLIHLKGLYED